MAMERLSGLEGNLVVDEIVAETDRRRVGPGVPVINARESGAQ